MNFKLLLCIGMGVFVAHLAVFMIIARVRLDRLPPPASPPVPNFSSSEAILLNPETGEKSVIREFRVSTKLVEPDAAAKRTNP